MAENKAQRPTNQNESDDDDDDEDENGEKKRNRAPSPFKSQSRVTVSVHSDLEDIDATVAEISGLLANHYSEQGFATRLVSRKRAEAKVPGIPSAMLYIAPKGYEFPATSERGLRLDSETANEIKAAASALGIDVNDKDALIKMLRSLATSAKKAATK